MIDYLIFGFSIASFVLVFLSLILIIKEKKNDNEKIKPGLNAIVFGLFFLLLFLIVDVLKYLDKVLEILVKDIALFGDYVNYLIMISDLVFVPLVAIFFVVAVLVFKKLK